MSIWKLIVLWISFLIVATIITPPDFISHITAAVMMAIIYGALILAIARFKLLKDTSSHAKTALAFLSSVGVTLLVKYVF
ncbi:MAG: hypothetical protein JW741_02430 [Sedimentisphaerales bacterium]|nr:hypothetical protein [Sedimentisphaerales bacterium]